MRTETSPSESTNAPEEIGILDVLIILSSRIRLILALSILGAAIGWLLTLRTPESFISTSTLNVETMGFNDKSPKFKSEVIASTINTNAAFRKLASMDSAISISATMNPKDRLVVLNTSAPTSEAALQLNEKALQELFSITIPQGSKTEQLRKILSDEKVRLASIEKTLRETEKNLKSEAKNSIGVYQTLLSIKMERELAVAKLQEDLEGLTRNNIIQAPTVSSAAQNNKKFLKILIGLLAGGFLSLIIVFVLHTIKTLISEKDEKEKIYRIARNLGFKNTIDPS